MLFHRITRSGAAYLCAALLTVSASALEVPAGDLYCFSPDDFGGDVRGICITAVPETGELCLGDRAIRSGDVLTADQLRALTFSHPESEEDARAVMEYLPIRADGLGAQTSLVFELRGRKNLPPTAGDSKLETYKNLPNEGLLDAADPEGDTLTFALVRPPKRGDVILRDDGSFLYTPKKNKVGTDSFTYTAADSAGNVSEEATVTVSILKPADGNQYTDTISSDCRFEAEWLRNTGIFTGETVNGQFCFSPDEPVSRGQFLAMLMEVLDMPVDRTVTATGFLDESPRWLQPYLAAALRSGIIAGYPADGGVEFRADRAVSADEAALMVSRALDFAVPTAAPDEASLPLGMDPLTRADAARTLYRVSLLRRESGLLGLFG